MDTFVTIEILLNHDWRGSRVCVYIPYLCLPPDSSLHQHTVYLAVNWSPLEMNSLEHWGGSRAVAYIESIHLHVLSMGHNLRLKNGVKCSINKHVSKHIAILIARQGVTIQASSDGGGREGLQLPRIQLRSLTLWVYLTMQTPRQKPLPQITAGIYMHPHFNSCTHCVILSPALINSTFVHSKRWCTCTNRNLFKGPTLFGEWQWLLTVKGWSVHISNTHCMTTWDVKLLSLFPRVLISVGKRWLRALPTTNLYSSQILNSLHAGSL